MANKFTLIFTFLLIGIFAQAQVDNFDYAAGNVVNGNGDNTGGWAGPWQINSDADSSLISNGGVFNDSLLVRTSNNKATIISTTAQNRYLRLFENPITSFAGSFWFSAHMSIDGNPAGNVGTMSLIDTSQSSQERLTIGKRFGNRNVFATGAGAGPTNTGQFFTGNAARWLVGFLEFDSANSQWLLDLWVSPDPSTVPTEADAKIQNKVFADFTFNGVGIKAEGAPGIAFNIDDIYVGNAFADVVPADLISINPAPSIASENFNYTAGDSIVSQMGGEGFTDPWASPDNQNAVIAETGITSNPLELKTSGNRIELTSNGRFVRPLNSDFSDNGRTYWASFWFQTENAGSNVSHFLLADSNAFGPTGGEGRLAQIGSGFGASNLGIVGGGTTNANTAEGHFYVVEIVTNGTAQNDDIYIYVDPDLTARPDRASADAFGSRNLSNWNAVGFIVAGDPGVTSRWDDVYLGASYNDVIPGDLEGTDPPITAFAFDQFNYPVGTSALGAGEMGDGWAGPWDTIVSSTFNGEIANGGVVNDNLLVRSSNNSFLGTSTGENNRFIRYFENPIDPNTTNEFWFSFQNSMEGNVGNNVGTIVLADTTLGQNYERIIIGKRFGNRNLFATGNGAGPTNSGKFYTASSSRWVVGNLTKSDTSDNWILNLWVDPLPNDDLDTVTADIENKMYPLATFNAASIKTGGQSGLKHNVDDLFFGNTFADVIPPDLEAVSMAPEGANDPMNYTAGEMLDGQSGGLGWDGNWVLTDGTDPSLVEPGIVNFELLKQTSGTKVSLAENARLMRKMDGEYGDDGRSYWVGFWFDSENGGPNVTNLVLADSETFPNGGAGELVQIGRSFNGSVLRIIGQGQTTANADEGHFVVLEILTNGNPTPDEIYMWVDPNLAVTPGRDSADVVGSANLSNWDAIGLKVAGDPGVVAGWDDIYIGRSYNDITPNDLEDVQSPDIPVVAYEGFDYPNASNLNMQNGGLGWLNMWEAKEGDITIAEGSISSDRIEGIGNKASIIQNASNVQYTRPYFAKFADSQTEKSEVWMSFLLDVTNNSIGNGGSVGIVDGDTELLSIGATMGLENFAVTYNGNQPLVAANQSVNGVNWVVVKMDIYGTGILDTASIWINPTADALPEVSNALFTITDLAIDNGFDGLSISANGAQTLDMFVDEIYTGFSYRDVSPGFGSDDPNLLVYEPFNYDPEESLFGQGGINAFWDGQWEDAGALGDVNEISITSGSIEATGFETIGNKVQFSYFEEATQIRADRKLAFPLRSDGSTYWITFFMNTTEGTALNNVGNVTLRNTNINASNGQRLSIGRLYGGGKLGFVTPATGNNRPTEIDDIGMNWMVARIATNADASIPDSVFLWINPDAGSEPDTSTMVAFGISDFMKAGPIDIIRIRTEGAAGEEVPYITNFDELRIASTWESARSFTVSTVNPHQEDKFKLAAYPNPVSGLLNIEFVIEQEDIYQIELLDVNGKSVKRIARQNYYAGNQKVQFNTDGLANGFYYLRIANHVEGSVRKIIVYN